MQKKYIDLKNNSNDSALFIQQFVSTLQNTDNKQLFQNSLNAFDAQLYDMFAGQNYINSAVTKQLYEQPIKTTKLQIPKNNSLTDSMLRSTLGCQQKLAKSYLQIIDNTQQVQNQEKRKRIQNAKKKFAQSNSHRDFCANTKPFLNNIKFALQRPVIENEHQSYLKTQLIFLQQPRGSQSINTKQYFDKHTDNIAKKINQLGGLEDTIGKMEESLSKNEVKSFKKKQILSQMNQQKRNLFGSSPTNSHRGERGMRDSWVNKSKQMRESFMSKLQIQ